ncbi:hypothetical protein [Haloplanus halobius]|uniref:hypothetical protein n=1 Tax=Haloplanus halobius TaxID=2934938 RepID=UPI00200C2DA1|nr:hypothetical protein [Haloplanus sp. XH21]
MVAVTIYIHRLFRSIHDAYVVADEVYLGLTYADPSRYRRADRAQKPATERYDAFPI